MAGTVICSKCGQENDPAETFCGSCGAFLEWSGQKVEGAEAAPPPMTQGQAAQSELAGLARPRPPEAQQPPPPPLVSPVRPGPSIRSVPPSPADVAGPSGVLAAPQRIVAPDPTITCPSCHRSNPIDRTFCHSCGTLLRPKPADSARPRRAGAGGSGIYRLVSIVLLIGIILVGSFLLTRLTAQPVGSGAPPRPTPSPTQASTDVPASPGAGSIGAVSWSVNG